MKTVPSTLQLSYILNITYDHFVSKIMSITVFQLARNLNNPILINPLDAWRMIERSSVTRNNTFSLLRMQPISRARA